MEEEGYLPYLSFLLSAENISQSAVFKLGIDY